MRVYRHILVALDLEADSLDILRRAHDLSLALGAELHMAHVVPPITHTVEVARQAQQQMDGLAREIGVDSDHWMVIEGNIKNEIVQAARDLDADLIVLGSHERHGMALLKAATEEAVARRAPCDVLEVRLPH